MLKLAVLMDPIAQININKDTSFAMLLAAQARGCEIAVIEAQNVWLQDGIVWGRLQQVHVRDDPNNWYHVLKTVEQPLVELDVLLMRKDPPFDMDYIYLTYLLEQTEIQGLRVINRPSSLRDANEKFFTTWFPQCCPRTLIASQAEQILAFLEEEQDIVLKPLHGMGGESIFRVRENDANTNVIIETLTKRAHQLVMAQRFIPEIEKGDKRILMINGEPVPFALARIPKAGEFRGNLAAGGRGEGRELSDRDHWICEQVGPTLVEKGLQFVGLDVIGDYLTEINVTSPTCVRELDAAFDLDIAGDFIERVVMNG